MEQLKPCPFCGGEAKVFMEEAYAQYRELRDRVETLAHGAEELIEVMIEEMIGAVHGL